MTGIRARGRVGSTIVPNWRWEDPTLDPYELRIAGWLVSHSVGWRHDHVTRNMIAARTRISQGKVSAAVETLTAAGIIEIETVEIRQAEGGKRWVITVDLDVWQQPVDNSADSPGPRSPHDQAPGHDTTNPGHHTTSTTGSSVQVDQDEAVTSTDVFTRGELVRATERLRNETPKHRQHIIDLKRAQRLTDMTPQPPIQVAAAALLGEEHGLTYWLAENPLQTEASALGRSSEQPFLFD